MRCPRIVRRTRSTTGRRSVCEQLTNLGAGMPVGLGTDLDPLKETEFCTCSSMQLTDRVEAARTAYSAAVAAV